MAANAYRQETLALGNSSLETLLHLADLEAAKPRRRARPWYELEDEIAGELSDSELQAIKATRRY